MECVSHQDSCEYCRIEFDLMIHYKNDHHRLDKGYCSFCFWFECLLHRKLNMTTNFQRKTNHRELKSKDLVRRIQRQSLYSSLMKDVGIDKSVKLRNYCYQISIMTNRGAVGTEFIDLVVLTISSCFIFMCNDLSGPWQRSQIFIGTFSSL